MYADLLARAKFHQERADEFQVRADEHKTRADRYAEAATALGALLQVSDTPDESPAATSDQTGDSDAKPPTPEIDEQRVAAVAAVERDRVSSKEAVQQILKRSGWMTIAQVTEQAVHEKLLAGDFSTNENRVKVATIRLERDGALERRPGPGRAFEFRIMPQNSQLEMKENIES